MFSIFPFIRFEFVKNGYNITFFIYYLELKLLNIFFRVNYNYHAEVGYK